MGELSRNNDALRLSYCSFILFFFLCVSVFFEREKREKELRVFLVFTGYSPLCVKGRRNRKKKGGKREGKRGCG